jgi:hypothetical protein
VSQAAALRNRSAALQIAPLSIGMAVITLALQKVRKSS